MGQEWACSSPFLFFTDHHEELGRKVTQGRRQEFRHFSAFRDPQTQDRIPDPQAETTVRASILKWAEAQDEPYASIRRLYQALLRLRKSEPALRATARKDFQVQTTGDDTILLRRQSQDGSAVLVVLRLRGEGAVDLRGHPLAQPGASRHWEVALTTEDPPFSPQPRPPAIDLSPNGPSMHFSGPAAVLLWETDSSRKWKEDRSP
jgi:maltooligosyltrehalose trehalohydrolase